METRFLPRIEVAACVAEKDSKPRLEGAWVTRHLAGWFGPLSANKLQRKAGKAAK